MLPIAMLVPRSIRRPIARPFAVALERAAGSRGGSRLVPQLAFIARWAAGPETAAATLARRLGTSAHTAPGAREQLVLLALDNGLPEVATDILASLGDETSPLLELARARLAFDQGRYTDALGHAEAAVGLGASGAPAFAERVRGHLMILRPEWLPDPRWDGQRTAAVRGQVTKGRILHLVTVSLPYRLAGYTVRTQSVIRAQIEAGLDAHVATRAGFPRRDGFPDAPVDELVDGVPYHRLAPDLTVLGRPDRTLTEAAIATAALVERLRPAALQPASNYLQARLAFAVARPVGLPVVYEVRGFWEESWAAGQGLDETQALATDRYWMSREAETAAMLEADAIVTLSETMRREIIDRGCPPDRITVVPNAVEIERFDPVTRDDALASSLGIEPSDLVVGYISTFNAYEGIPVLLEAAARLRAQGRRLRVLLVGDGDQEAVIREAGRRLGLDDGTLVMPGRVSHGRIRGYYSLIDVFVVPRIASRVSRLVAPLKPFEAMALERAVVVSDLPVLREIVTPNETGMTFTADDPDDLARVVGGLLDDPALRARLGRQAREWIAIERTWAENGRRYRELYERLGVV